MRIAIVDGFSAGAHLARALTERGADCVHVRSQRRANDYYEASFAPDAYVADLGFEPHRPKVAAELAALGVDRVIPGTESGVILADRLAADLGLPGNDLEQLGARRDKHAMASALARAGLDHPRGVVASDPDTAWEWLGKSGVERCVVKPLDSAASDSVRFCSTRRQVEAACRLVLASHNIFGRRNRVAVVQEELIGREYFVNTASVAGRHRVVEVWRYTKTRSAVGSPVFDYEEPVEPGSAAYTSICDYLMRALDALGVSNAATHCEVMLTERGPVLLDAGVRLGGGVLPWVYERYMGDSHVSVYARSIVDPGGFGDLALPLTPDRCLRYVSMINHHSGLVRSMDWARRLRDVGSVVAAVPLVGVGDRLRPTDDLFSSPGFVYLAAHDRSAVVDDYERIREWERSGIYLN